MRFSWWLENSEESFLGEILKSAENPNLISFAGGFPAPELFPVDDLKAAFNEVLTHDNAYALQYGDAAGYFNLREWISKQHTRHGQRLTPEDVVITTGSQQGLNLVAQALLDPGDIIFVETPTYIGALQAFQMYRPRIMMVPSDIEGILPDELEKMLQKHNPKFLYLIPNYQNPTGKIMGKERRNELIAVASKYELCIVEDNPYGELRFEGEPQPNLLDLSENVIYLGTFSKVLAPGLRVGYIIGDPKVIEFVTRVKEAVDLHSNNLTQRAVYQYLQRNLLPSHIAKLRTIYKSRRDAMVQALHRYLEGEVEIIVPSGGMFLWAKFTGIKDSFKYLEDTIRQNVIYVPGAVFYPDHRISSEMRLNFSCSPPEVIDEGIRRLAQAVRKKY